MYKDREKRNKTKSNDGQCLLRRSGRLSSFLFRTALSGKYTARICTYIWMPTECKRRGKNQGYAGRDGLWLY